MPRMGMVLLSFCLPGGRRSEGKGEDVEAEKEETWPLASGRALAGTEGGGGSASDSVPGSEEPSAPLALSSEGEETGGSCRPRRREEKAPPPLAEGRAGGRRGREEEDEEEGVEQASAPQEGHLLGPWLLRRVGGGREWRRVPL